LTVADADVIDHNPSTHHSEGAITRPCDTVDTDCLKDDIFRALPLSLTEDALAA